MSRKTICFLTLLSAVLIISCTRTTEEIAAYELRSERIAELYPLKKGKYITYRLDSLVFTRLGTEREIRRYQVKYVVDTALQDNLGHTTYRIYSYLNDSLAKGGWIPRGTSTVTMYDNRVEEQENNLRSIILMLPVKPGFTWLGGRYISTAPFGLEFSNMDKWEYTYSDYNREKIGNRFLDSVITVEQVAELNNALYDRPIVDTIYARNETALAKYAKNVGLVYKEMTIWENQTNLVITIDPIRGDSSRSYQPYRKGFGIKMWMVDHN